MKHRGCLKSLILISVIALFLAPFVLAQKPAAENGGKASSPKYDFATETKLKGTVEEVTLVTTPNNTTCVMLKASSQTILVHIAPPEFLKEFEFPVNKGDQIEVVGSKLTVDGQEMLLAREITNKDNSVTLRDKKGVPVWTAWPKK